MMEGEFKFPTADPPKNGSIQSPVMPSEESDKQNYRVYPGRFYVLTVFAFLSIVQSCAWLTFGTIPNESLQEFGLTDDDVTLLAGIKVTVHS